ncbi:MAG TPA: acyl-CoA dehydrogenase family protein [Terrimesophilobacter sp.]|nr:acyl-CoA dehydrogenase family protein [Terrimesophilobacter sp.]
MDLPYPNLTDEQAELAELALSVLGADPESLIAGAQEGLFGVGTAEELGGSGGSFELLAPILDVGGSLTAASALPWVAGIILPALAMTDVQGRVLSGLVSGELTVAVPVNSPYSEVSGRLLAWGPSGADLIVVPRCFGNEAEIIVLDRGHKAWRASETPVLDSSRQLSMHAIDLENIPDGLTVDPAEIDRWEHGRILIAAFDSIGAAREALSRTVRYAKVRQQFGRPLGSFQAYRHTCAVAYQRLRLVESLAYSTVRNADWSTVEACRSIPRTAVWICSQAVQLHGATGFSEETGIGALLRRARANEMAVAS